MFGALRRCGQWDGRLSSAGVKTSLASNRSLAESPTMLERARERALETVLRGCRRGLRTSSRSDLRRHDKRRMTLEFIATDGDTSSPTWCLNCIGAPRAGTANIERALAHARAAGDIDMAAELVAAIWPWWTAARWRPCETGPAPHRGADPVDDRVQPAPVGLVAVAIVAYLTRKSSTRGSLSGHPV